MNAKRSLWPKKLVTAVLLQIGYCVVLIIGLWWGWHQITLLYTSVVERQLEWESTADTQVRQTRLKKELETHHRDVTRIQELLPTRDTISDVVGVIESAATRAQVTAEVPDISPVVTLDADRKPLPNTGPIVDVRFTIRAQGNPLQLVYFLYDLEHLPYIVGAPQWHIRNTSSTPLAVLETQVPGEDGEESTPVIPGELSAVLLVSMHNSDYEAH